ncbi:MAG: hypothetical protein ACIALR_11195, partial [Blastopirellula sp. JB062]
FQGEVAINASGGLDADQITIDDANDLQLADMHTKQLTANAGGDLTQSAGTTIEIDQAATFIAKGEIRLATDATDVLKVGDLATFSSIDGKEIEVGVDNSVIRGTDSGATVEFGSLTFSSDDGKGLQDAVTIREDNATLLVGINQADSLVLTSAGAISNQANAELNVAGNATFT